MHWNPQQLLNWEQPLNANACKYRGNCFMMCSTSSLCVIGGVWTRMDINLRNSSYKTTEGCCWILLHIENETNNNKKWFAVIWSLYTSFWDTLYIYIYIYIYRYRYMYLRVCECLYVYISLYTIMWIYMYVYVCTFTYMYYCNHHQVKLSARISLTFSICRLLRPVKGLPN